MREQYIALKRKIVLIMAAAAIIPLIILAAINYVEFQSTFAREMQTPFRSIVAKTKNSFELFLAERGSTVNLIASLYAYADLADPRTLRRVFLAMQNAFSGFADLGLIDDKGRLVNYVGPYADELQGVDYSGQDWFNKVRMHGRYISEVFSGFRHVPHVVVAVRHSTEDGQSWIVRATLDTTQFARIIAAMNLEPGSDAFLLNRRGVLQTDSALFGKTLENIPLTMPTPVYDATIMETTDKKGDPLLLSYAYIPDSDFVLMAVKTSAGMFNAWLMVRSDLLLVFLISALCIYFVAGRSVGRLIERLRSSDEEREKAMLQMEHSQKLSSIGRLAAGVAHEVNNPLAIINEKAGLLQDILDLNPDYPRREVFRDQLASITAAVKRCRDITQRMLGFARRMNVKIEMLRVNDMIAETLAFLESEARHRQVAIVRELDKNLPAVPCDRGQLQQVFLNILTNALAAVSEGGQVVIRSFARGDQAAVSFKDNGLGMDEETRSHIFEPFFTTKGDKGTGLGMAIIYGIVKRHGGDIEVESEPGRGTTITVLLPLKQSATGAAT
jgi:two-component system NtrC family sensor kinase